MEAVTRLTLAEARRRLNIEESWLPPGRKNRPGGIWPKTSVTIHGTDNSDRGANARRHALYMQGPDAAYRRVSWQYTVDSERVVKHLPVTEASYHCGVTRGNRHSIGIEICQNVDGDFAAAVDRAALLAAYLMEVCGVDTLRSHRDWNAKNCPAKLFAEVGWGRFAGLVTRYRAALRTYQP